MFYNRKLFFCFNFCWDCIFQGIWKKKEKWLNEQQVFKHNFVIKAEAYAVSFPLSMGTMEVDQF